MRLSPPDSTRIRSSGRVGRDQVVDGVEVGGDVVADRGVRAAAGLHGGDPLVGQHGVAAQEVRVLGGVDVVGQHGQRQLVAQLPAQRGHERGLARADGPADADAQRLPRLPDPLGPVVLVVVRFAVDEMRWHGSSFWVSECHETNSGRSRRRAAGRARRAAGRTGRRVLGRAWPAVSSHSVGQLEGHAATSRGVEGEQTLRGGRRPGHGRCRRPTSAVCSAVQAAATVRPSPTRRQVRRGPERLPVVLRPDPCAPAAAARGPAPATRRAAAGAGVRASVSRVGVDRRCSVPACTAAAIDAVTSPWVRIRRRRNASQRGEVADQPAGDGLLDAAGVHVAAGGQPRVGERQQGGEAASEQEIALRHRQFGGRLLLPHVAVDADRERVRVDLDARQRVVERHVGLAHARARR